MNRLQAKGCLTLASLALLLALGACNRADQRTASERGEASKSSQGVSGPAKPDESSTGAAATAGDSTRTMGAAGTDPLDDRTITAKVNAALTADQELSALKIDVDTQNGVVTLSGPAPTATAKEHASEVARTVKGVTSVNNQLTLKSS